MKPFAGTKQPLSLYRLYLANRGRRAVLEQRLMFEAAALLDDSVLHPQQVKQVIFHMKSCRFVMQG